jgi:ribosomal protein S18 acetylase RimI-like enzyme
MEYRILKKEEYSQLAIIHLQAFEGFFLSTLGLSFLKTYYRSSLKNEECVAVCSCNSDNSVVGFAIGTVTSKGYHRRLILNNFFPFLFEMIRLLFKKPQVLIRLFRNLNKSPEKFDDGHYAELLSIGVSTSYKGLGVGKQLIQHFEKELTDRGCKRVVLTTDFYDNDKILEFYFKQSYKVFYEFYAYPNRKMYKLFKDLNQ